LRAESRGRGAETGDKQGRDGQLAHLVDLRKRAVSPQIAQMKQLLIGRISIPSGFIRVWYSLEPWGSYKTYLFCRVYNPAGEQVLRIALESADFDQPQFAKEHPDLAALTIWKKGVSFDPKHLHRQPHHLKYDFALSDILPEG
jgi:hypothetical protein